MRPVTDLHSHILPGVDDGSACVEESLAMLGMAARQGIRLMVATPHFDPRVDTPQEFLTRRNRAADRLQPHMTSDMPRLLLGAEVRYFPGISDSDAVSLLCLEGGKALLLELPEGEWPAYLWEELACFRERTGIIPIIAHLDRYISPFKTRRIPERLAELPLLIQANSRFFGNPMTRPLAMRLLREDKIHLLGSDCHGMEHRKPDLEKTLALIGPMAHRIAQYEETILPPWAVEIYRRETEKDL